MDLPSSLINSQHLPLPPPTPTANTATTPLSAAMLQTPFRTCGPVVSRPQSLNARRPVTMCQPEFSGVPEMEPGFAYRSQKLADDCCHVCGVFFLSSAVSRNVTLTVLHLQNKQSSAGL